MPSSGARIGRNGRSLKVFKVLVLKAYRFVGFYFLLFCIVALHPCVGQWVKIGEVKSDLLLTELGGPAVEIAYELLEPGITADKPVYVFVRVSTDQGMTLRLAEPTFLQGDGFGIVTSPGKKKIMWWGSGLSRDKVPLVRVRGIHMARVPEGQFIMKGFPAGGKDPSISERPDSNLPEYFMAINEVTNEMYVEYLKESKGAGWNDRMGSQRRGGIVKKDSLGTTTFTLIPGREHHPITHVSWYDGYAFLQWCGLQFPTEAMFEKAFVGGNYLDGDQARSQANPNPERKFPWGDEAPDEGGVYRCNFDGEADGYSNLAPVGSFSNFASPYGINDLAGNVAEWTLDWYTTTYHVGLDGFRMVRGGSWLAMPVECDAVSGATQFPIKESSIMGFRGVFVR